MKSHIICDIDGTLSNPEHRLHYLSETPANWDKFYDQCYYDHAYSDVVQILNQFHDFNIIYVTGRRSDVRQKTKRWLNLYNLPTGLLFMRAENDFREDWVVKQEIVEERLSLKPEDVLFILEDRDQVVQMWRKNGFRCLQVANGGY